MRNLFTDIDSTINNHWERIKRFAIGDYPPRQIDPKAFSEEEVLKDQVAFESVYWLNRFKEAGWKIHYLSARPKHLLNATTTWLDRHHFPVDTLNLVDSAHDKPSFLKSVSVDLFVDDLARNHENGEPILYHEIISKLKKIGIPFVIFKGDWSEIYSKYALTSPSQTPL